MNRFVLTKSILKATTELFPSLTSIFLGDLLLVFLFLNVMSERLSIEYFGYAVLEALGLICIGRLSDKWSRKKTLITVHFLTLPLLIVLYFYISKEQMGGDSLKTHVFYLLAGGLIYCPGPPSRAIIVDNYKSTVIKMPNKNFYTSLSLTETRLIAISWIVQYLPWALAPFLASITRSQHLLILIILMGLNIPFMFFRLIDAMEKSLQIQHEPLAKSFNKSPLTFSGLFLAQIVFWATFDKIDLLQDRQFIFSLVGIGAAIGSIFSLFHKKTPHISAITNYYEFGIVLSLISLLFSYYYGDTVILLAFQLIMISAIGGFYLPFVYDIVVSKSGMHYRGMMFACAEVVQGVSSVFGILLMSLAGSNSTILFLTTTILFLLAHQLQSREKMA